MQTVFNFLFNPRSVKGWSLFWISVLLGPMIGFIGLMFIPTILAGDPTLIRGLIYLVPYIYFIGTPIAAIACIIVLVILRFKKNISAILVGGIGGVFANLYLAFFSGSIVRAIDLDKEAEAANIFMFYGPFFSIGFVAALVCFLLASDPISKSDNNN